jgi:hypothetical protein
MQSAHAGEAVIVGGGPSVEDSISEIEEKSRNGAIVLALNGASDYLNARGIQVDWQVSLDARPENVDFVKSRVAGGYFVASQCDPSVFDAVHGKPVILFHPHIGDIEKYIIGTGEGNAGRRRLDCRDDRHVDRLYAGFRRVHLYGYDSSYMDDRHHAYAQAGNDKENCVEAIVRNRRFKAAAWMVRAGPRLSANVGVSRGPRVRNSCSR